MGAEEIGNITLRVTFQYPLSNKSRVGSGCVQFIDVIFADLEKMIGRLTMKIITGIFSVVLILMSNTLYAGVVEADKAFQSSEFKKAFTEYSKCAEQGDAKCQYWTGYLHQVALGGMEQDLNKAVTWIRKAAKNGYPRAQYHMGEYYQHAFGLPKDMKKAEAYYRKAAANNYSAAKDVLYTDFGVQEFKPKKIKLNDKQIKFLFSGTTISAVDLKKGNKYKIYFDGDGSTAYSSQNGKVEKTTYKIKGNELCIRLKGKNRCATITANGDSTYTRINLKGKSIATWDNHVRGKKL